MALLTPVISLAGRVTERQKDLFLIVFSMVWEDDLLEEPVLEARYTLKYRPGDNPADAVEEITAYFQAKINSYQAASAIENHPTLAAAIAAIQDGLVT